jgi:hypothetical protein
MCWALLLFCFTGKLLFVGFTIINLVLICSIDTSCLLMFFFHIEIQNIDMLASPSTRIILKEEKCIKVVVEDIDRSRYKIHNLKIFNKVYHP